MCPDLFVNAYPSVCGFTCGHYRSQQRQWTRKQHHLVLTRHCIAPAHKDRGRSRGQDSDKMSVCTNCVQPYIQSDIDAIIHDDDDIPAVNRRMSRKSEFGNCGNHWLSPVMLRCYMWKRRDWIENDWASLRPCCLEDLLSWLVPPGHWWRFAQVARHLRRDLYVAVCSFLGVCVGRVCDMVSNHSLVCTEQPLQASESTHTKSNIAMAEISELAVACKYQWLVGRGRCAHPSLSFQIQKGITAARNDSDCRKLLGNFTLSKPQWSCDEGWNPTNQTLFEFYPNGAWWPFRFSRLLESAVTPSKHIQPHRNDMSPANGVRKREGKCPRSS